MLHQVLVNNLKNDLNYICKPTPKESTPSKSISKLSISVKNVKTQSPNPRKRSKKILFELNDQIYTSESEWTDDEKLNLIITDLSILERTCSIWERVSSNLIQLGGCEHKYHKEWLIEKIKTRLKNGGWLERWPIHRWTASISKTTISEQLTGHDLVAYESLWLVCELNNWGKFITYWWEPCRYIFVKKRNRSDKCKKWRVSAKRLRKIFECNKSKNLSSAWQEESAKKFALAIEDSISQIPKCKVWNRWKHKFHKTRVYRWICNQKFL